uniref:Uncharacterized protein n=1 Tax=Setaria viridis TaxID=4556 RepID=A0A4U6WGM9_SETVI|nr:hypothetical protein SEVIR_1G299800v2 [Setaria viridis]
MDGGGSRFGILDSPDYGCTAGFTGGGGGVLKPAGSPKHDVHSLVPRPSGVR